MRVRCDRVSLSICRRILRRSARTSLSPSLSAFVHHHRISHAKYVLSLLAPYPLTILRRRFRSILVYIPNGHGYTTRAECVLYITFIAHTYCCPTAFDAPEADDGWDAMDIFPQGTSCAFVFSVMLIVCTQRAPSRRVKTVVVAGGLQRLKVCVIYCTFTHLTPFSWYRFNQRRAWGRRDIDG